MKIAILFGTIAILVSQMAQAFEFSYSTVFDANALDHVLDTESIQRYDEDWGTHNVTFWTPTLTNQDATLVQYFDFTLQATSVHLIFNLASGINAGHTGYARMDASTDGLIWTTIAERVGVASGRTTYELDLQPELLDTELYLRTVLSTTGPGTWDPKFAQFSRMDESLDNASQPIFSLQAATVPEPSGFAFLVLSLAACGILRWRRSIARNG